jgi:putative secretion ATPase (PEP-CTERM system associated)
MYEAFYHLSGKPFQLSPDPSFFFESRVHKRAYAYLEYGLYQGEGFIVITGEVGAGKTILVRNLLNHLDSERVVAAHLVSTQLDADDLLRAVATALGLPAKGADKGSLLAELEQYLHDLAALRKRLLLIVDEAQNLAPRALEELRMLSNFQMGESALVQSFLVGQPELRKILQGPELRQFRQRVIASYHLGPLDLLETQAYVQHRLKQVGWAGDPQLEQSAYEAIFEFSGGIPRRINLVCNRLLLAGYLNERHVLDATDVETVASEIEDELGAIGRPREGSESYSTALEGALASGGPSSFHSEWDQQIDGLEVGTGTTGSPGKLELAARVSRLESAVTRVLGMLRRRSGQQTDH